MKVKRLFTLCTVLSGAFLLTGFATVLEKPAFWFDDLASEQKLPLSELNSSTVGFYNANDSPEFDYAWSNESYTSAIHKLNINSQKEPLASESPTIRNFSMKSLYLPEDSTEVPSNYGYELEQPTGMSQEEALWLLQHNVVSRILPKVTFPAPVSPSGVISSAQQAKLVILTEDFISPSDDKSVNLTSDVLFAKGSTVDAETKTKFLIELYRALYGAIDSRPIVTDKIPVREAEPIAWSKTFAWKGKSHAPHGTLQDETYSDNGKSVTYKVGAYDEGYGTGWALDGYAMILGPKHYYNVLDFVDNKKTSSVFGSNDTDTANSVQIGSSLVASLFPNLASSTSGTYSTVEPYYAPGYWDTSQTPQAWVPGSRVDTEWKPDKPPTGFGITRAEYKTRYALVNNYVSTTYNELDHVLYTESNVSELYLFAWFNKGLLSVDNLEDPLKGVTPRQNIIKDSYRSQLRQEYISYTQGVYPIYAPELGVYFPGNKNLTNYGTTALSSNVGPLGRRFNVSSLGSGQVIFGQNTYTGYGAEIEYVKPNGNEVDGLFENEGLLGIDALRFSYDAMRIAEGDMTKTESTLVSYKYGMGEMADIHVDDRVCISYLVAKGILDFEDQFEVASIYAPLTKEQALEWVYRIANVDARTVFTTVQLTDADSLWVGRGFGSLNLTAQTIDAKRYEMDVHSLNKEFFAAPLANVTSARIVPEAEIESTNNVLQSTPIAHIYDSTPDEIDSSYVLAVGDTRKIISPFGTVSSNSEQVVKPQRFEIRVEFDSPQITVPGSDVTEVQKTYYFNGKTIQDWSTTVDQEVNVYNVVITPVVSDAGVDDGRRFNFTLDAYHYQDAVDVIMKGLHCDANGLFNADAVAAVATISSSTGAKLSYIKAEDLVKIDPDIVIVSDRVLLNKTTNTRAVIDNANGVALVGNQVVVGEKDTLVLAADGDIYYNYDAISALLGSLYRSTINIKAVCNTNTAYTIGTEVDVLSEQNELLGKGIMKKFSEEITDKGLTIPERTGLNISLLGFGSSHLIRSFSAANESGNTITFTIIVEYRLALPPAELNYEELALTTSTYTDFSSVAERADFLFKKPSPSTPKLLKYWESNYDLNNTLASFMYGATGEYVKSGYLIPNITVLTNVHSGEALLGDGSLSMVASALAKAGQTLKDSGWAAKFVGDENMYNVVVPSGLTVAEFNAQFGEKLEVAGTNYDNKVISYRCKWNENDEFFPQKDLNTGWYPLWVHAMFNMDTAEMGSDKKELWHIMADKYRKFDPLFLTGYVNTTGEYFYGKVDANNPDAFREENSWAVLPTGAVYEIPGESATVKELASFRFENGTRIRKSKLMQESGNTQIKQTIEEFDTVVVKSSLADSTLIGLNEESLAIGDFVHYGDFRFNIIGFKSGYAVAEIIDANSGKFVGKSLDTTSNAFTTYVEEVKQAIFGDLFEQNQTVTDWNTYIKMIRMETTTSLDLIPDGVKYISVLGGNNMEILRDGQGKPILLSPVLRSNDELASDIKPFTTPLVHLNADFFKKTTEKTSDDFHTLVVVDDIRSVMLGTLSISSITQSIIDGVIANASGAVPLASLENGSEVSVGGITLTRLVRDGDSSDVARFVTSAIAFQEPKKSELLDVMVKMGISSEEFKTYLFQTAVLNLAFPLNRGSVSVSLADYVTSGVNLAELLPNKSNAYTEIGAVTLMRSRSDASELHPVVIKTNESLTKSSSDYNTAALVPQYLSLELVFSAGLQAIPVSLDGKYYTLLFSSVADGEAAWTNLPYYLDSMNIPVLSTVSVDLSGSTIGALGTAETVKAEFLEQDKVILLEGIRQAVKWILGIALAWILVCVPMWFALTKQLPMVRLFFVSMKHPNGTKGVDVVKILTLGVIDADSDVSAGRLVFTISTCLVLFTVVSVFF